MGLRYGHKTLLKEVHGKRPDGRQRHTLLSVTVGISKRLRWVNSVARMAITRNAYRKFVAKLLGKWSLARPKKTAGIITLIRIQGKYFIKADGTR
jgi:hypothetical protein